MQCLSLSVGGAVAGGALRRGGALPDAADSLHTHTEQTTAGNSPVTHLMLLFEHTHTHTHTHSHTLSTYTHRADHSR